jgi:hypothetical protein
MICPFLSARRPTVAALVLAVSAAAFNACSNTDTSAAVGPLTKHVSGPLSLTFTFQKVDDGTDTAVTGINDSQEIVGTYCLSACVISSLSNRITQSFTSTPSGTGLYGTFVGDNYPQPVDAGDIDTSTYLVAINPGKVATAQPVEAGWAVEPGNLFFTLALVNNQGLWSVFHTFPSGGEDGKSECRIMELSGINDSYDAVGYYTKHNGTTSKCPTTNRRNQAFEASPGEGFKEIQLPASFSFSNSAATGIDNAGNVVGWGDQSASTQMVGWYYPKPLSGGIPNEIAIPGEPKASVVALGINGDGETVAGSYSVASRTYGFLCTAPCKSSSSFQTGINECGNCNTFVYGINDTNEICGYYIGVDGNQHGFVATSSPLRRRAGPSHSSRSLQASSAGPST